MSFQTAIRFLDKENLIKGFVVIARSKDTSALRKGEYFLVSETHLKELSEFGIEYENVLEGTEFFETFEIVVRRTSKWYSVLFEATYLGGKLCHWDGGIVGPGFASFKVPEDKADEFERKMKAEFDSSIQVHRLVKNNQLFVNGWSRV